MNVLTRWDPLQEMLDFNRAMDLVRQRTSTLGDGHRSLTCPMDIYETPGGL